jgi:small subunit ribosomal protein S20
MLSYGSHMPNTKSAKKAQRSSARKGVFNTFWKKKIKDVVKSLKDVLNSGKVATADLSKNLSVTQKTLDKAAKNKVIHKNKANRLKSRYAKRISATAKAQ